MRHLLWAACSQLLPQEAGLHAHKLSAAAVVATLCHSPWPTALLAASGSSPSVSVGLLWHPARGHGAPCRWGSQFNVPPSAQFVARPVGVCSMMKLPVQASAEGLDAAFVGVPLDTGTSNRPGAR